MYEAEETISSVKGLGFYKSLLSFYPKHYRKHFGQEMLFAFADMYQEELAKNGEVGIGFWLSIFADTTKSITQEHTDMIQKQGIKNYFHISNYNIIGGILLLPFIFLFGVDFFGRLVQGDFTHYNRAWYAVISNTFFYTQTEMLWTILVLCPILAIILNLIPFIISLKKNNKLAMKSILFLNPVALSVVAVGLFCLLVVYGHDAVPCFINHVSSQGLGNFWHIVSVCRKA